MDHLLPVTQLSHIHPTFRGTPIEDLRSFHNFDRPHDSYNTAPLVIGMCMDHRERLRNPQTLCLYPPLARRQFRSSDFHLSYAIAVGGVSALSDLRNALW